MSEAAATEAAGMDLGRLPLAVLGLYVVVLLGLGVYGFLKSKRTEEDYYLAGRRQGFIVTALTIMATFFSSAAMLGIPGAVYKDGVPFLLFALNLPVSGAAVYVLGSRIARVGRAKGYVTPADMVADYYDGSAAVRLLVALLGFLYVVPYVVIQLRAGGNLANQMFPDTPAVVLLGRSYDMFDVGAAVLSAVMMVYILVGGMRSVAMADVIQGSLLLFGMLITGVAVIAAFGGVREYFGAVAELPPEALSLPGASGRYTCWALMTLCMFASVASLIQPAQWMRYYAARSTRTLKRTALVFSLLLPPCYLFGVMIAALGARALYPPAVENGVLTAHSVVGRFDQAVIVVLRNHGTELFGAAGAAIVAVLMMAILAASMSTADSNLHALSAVLTRDVYDRFIRPKAGQTERAWVGRGVIVAATLLALGLVRVGERNADFAPLRMIVEMQFVAMAFACQVLPVTVDMLFVHRGTRAGAVAGMVTGLAVVLLFTPLPKVILGAHTGASVADLAGHVKRLFDIGFCGFVPNVVVFTLVSWVTKKPDPGRIAEFARLMRTSSRRRAQEQEEG